MGIDSSCRALPNGVFTVMGKSRPEDRTITNNSFLYIVLLKTNGLDMCGNSIARL